MGGYSLAHAMMMLIPEAWESHTLMDENARLLRIPRRDDGAVGRPRRRGLHRRPPDRRDARPQRLRPARYLVTDDDLVVMASGIRRAADPDEKIVRSGACSPARCS